MYVETHQITFPYLIFKILLGFFAPTRFLFFNNTHTDKIAHLYVKQILFKQYSMFVVLNFNIFFLLGKQKCCQTYMGVFGICQLTHHSLSVKFFCVCHNFSINLCIELKVSLYDLIFEIKPQIYRLCIK